MADITCEVIKDLLPLYVDGVLSEDSRKLVEEHLQSCKECREYYDNLKDDDIEAKQEKAAGDKAALKRIRRKINMRKLLVGCVAALVVAAGAFIAYDRLMLNESYLSYDESGLYVEDNMLKTATGYHCQYGFDAPGNEIEFITLTTTPYENYRNSRSDVKDIREVRDLSKPQESVIEYDGVKEFHKIKKIYYVPPEYAEKVMGQGYWSDDHDESTGEEGYIKANKDKIDELISVSTLLWEDKSE